MNAGLRRSALIVIVGLFSGCASTTGAPHVESGSRWTPAPRVILPTTAQEHAKFVTVHAAAVHGDSAAEFTVGSDYLRGVNVTQDDKKAAVWLRKAAVRGSGTGAV